MENDPPTNKRPRLSARIGTTPYSPEPAPEDAVVGELQVDLPEDPPTNQEDQSEDGRH